jgi:hypothetical protein
MRAVIEHYTPKRLPMLTREVIRSLSKIVGGRHCKTGAEDLICYGYDATNLHYSPEAVVFPADAQQVEAISLGVTVCHLVEVLLGTLRV